MDFLVTFTNAIGNLLTQAQVSDYVPAGVALFILIISTSRFVWGMIKGR